MLMLIGEVYLLLVNIVAFCMIAIDKKNARWGGKRIPEKTLLLTALIGGSIGIYGGMRVFRHKTRQVKFSLGVPVIIALQVFLVMWISNL